MKSSAPRDAFYFSVFSPASLTVAPQRNCDSVQPENPPPSIQATQARSKCPASHLPSALYQVHPRHHPGVISFFHASLTVAPFELVLHWRLTLTQTQISQTQVHIRRISTSHLSLDDCSIDPPGIVSTVRTGLDALLHRNAPGGFRLVVPRVRIQARFALLHLSRRIWRAIIHCQTRTCHTLHPEAALYSRPRIPPQS